MIASVATRPPSTAVATASASATGAAPLTVACPTATVASRPAIVASPAAGRVRVVVAAAGAPTSGHAMAIVDPA